MSRRTGRVLVFPVPIAAGIGEPSPLPPFDPRGPASPAAARLLRSVLAHLALLLASDPWLPVPQTTCTFRFGDRKGPLPLGALAILWARWPAATGPCPACCGRAYTFAFGGLLQVGGGLALCSECGARLFRPLGGLSAVGVQVRPFLLGTEFRLTVGILGGGAPGPLRPLLRALWSLGVQP